MNEIEKRKRQRPNTANTNFEQGIDDDLMASLSKSLSEQVNGELATGQMSQGDAMKKGGKKKKKKKMSKAVKILGSIFLCLLLVLGFLVITKPGRQLIYNGIGNYLYGAVENDPDTVPGNTGILGNGESVRNPGARKEDYAINILITGIEEIKGGARTDSMLIASINTKDNTIKLVSLLRDAYVDIPGFRKDKLNAAYGKGGIQMLIDTIETNFKIHLDGYASVNFESFEAIVDRLDGIDLELGKSEAQYLRTTNYISNPAYRTVQAGWNYNMNGNQVLGYCRVRKRPTVEGVNDDYGRSLRHRKVLKAIFDKYKSKNVFELIPIMNDCLGYVKTNLTAAQMEKVIEAIVENGITEMVTARIPAEGMYDAPEKYENTTYPLILDFDANIKELHRIIFLDPTETPTPDEDVSDK